MVLCGARFLSMSGKGSLPHIQIHVAGTQQLEQNPGNPRSYAWVNQAVTWMTPSGLQDSQVLLAIEHCRPEIDKFLDSLLDKKINIRGTFSVESAASAVITAAMGRKIAGQMQVFVHHLH